MRRRVSRATPVGSVTAVERFFSAEHPHHHLLGGTAAQFGHRGIRGERDVRGEHRAGLVEQGLRDRRLAFQHVEAGAGHGVVAVLGSTFDGSYEPAAEICAALDRLQVERGWEIPVHVDGASGGMIAPFCDPGLEWDFRLPLVASINTSGHKYGLVYPGVGWVVWREADALPEDLLFRVNYLGGEMPTFALNFSRPGAQVAAQYYNFLRLGMDGYRRVQRYCREVASELAERIGHLGPFRLLTDGRQLPVFAFTLAENETDYSVFDVSAALREHGWLVPAYTFPSHREDLAVRGERRA